MPDPSMGQPGASSPQVIAMLTAAERIADGLADLALAIYDADPRWKDQLAAANAASTHIQEARREADREAQQIAANACPGCGFIGGHGITKQGRYWHERCWIKALEANLREFVAWFAEHDGKAEDFGELFMVGRAKKLLDGTEA